MNTSSFSYKDVAEYISKAPKDVQKILNAIRQTIRKAAPESEEGIAYGMPAYKLNKKPLVYFAAFKNHIGFYATPSGHAQFAKELSFYKQGKGSVQFPLHEPIPLDLIAKIVAFRVEENKSKSKLVVKSNVTVSKEIQEYNAKQSAEDKAICDLLARELSQHLPEAENKVWHAHPVWFLNGNPIVGYNKLKDSVRLLFWSGASFEEEQLKAGSGKYKDASVRYTSVSQINTKDLQRWLEKSRDIQWDYKNIVKRKGELLRLK